MKLKNESNMLIGLKLVKVLLPTSVFGLPTHS